MLTCFQSRVSVLYITLTGNSKILPILSVLWCSDLAALATEQRHSPNPVFDPPRGETRRRKTRRCSPKCESQSPVEAFVRLGASPNSNQKILSCLSRRRRPSFLFLHARTSVASSSGHQTAEMGAVTLHSGLGNPTLRQRHTARRRVGDHSERPGNAPMFGNANTSGRVWSPKHLFLFDPTILHI